MSRPHFPVVLKRDSVQALADRLHEIATKCRSRSHIAAPADLSEIEDAWRVVVAYLEVTRPKEEARGLEFTTNTSVPRGELWVVQDGKVVGKVALAEVAT